VKKKAGKKTTRGVKNLAAKPVAAKQGNGIKGSIKIQGTSKSTDVTFKRGVTSG